MITAVKPVNAYYNEIDPYAAQWLRNLIDAGEIATGIVDERSIEDVAPNDLMGYAQCHFFAGIGGWSRALRIAGWPDDRPVWTGSPPCQPFSAAGKRGGTADERHLWPALFHLVRLLRPATLFMEQVASKDGLAWLDIVLGDLEGASYAVAPFDLCAAGIGAPHRRQRLFIVADTLSAGRTEGRAGAGNRSVAGSGGTGIVADTGVERCGGETREICAGRTAIDGRGVERVADTKDANRRARERREEAGIGENGKRRRGPAGGSTDGGICDAERAGLEGQRGDGNREKGRAQQIGPAPEAGADGCPMADSEGGGAGAEEQRRRLHVNECESAGGRSMADADPERHAVDTQLRQRPSDHPETPGRGAYDRIVWLLFTDGKFRPTEPGTFPLSHVLPRGMGQLEPGIRELPEMAGCNAETLREAKRNRLGRIKGYGNAIVPELAAEFIKSSQALLSQLIN